MKAILLLVSFFVLCVSTTGVVADHKSHKNKKPKNCKIHKTYPKAQAEVLATFEAIAKSITAGAGHGSHSKFMDRLISFHAYGDKFVEFNAGQAIDSAGNEINERTFFGTIVAKGGVQQFAPIEGTLKVAVYCGNVANLTFISDFILNNDPDLDPVNEYTVNNLITLLFVKTKGKWKMVHEHHSQCNEVQCPKPPVN